MQPTRIMVQVAILQPSNTNTGSKTNLQESLFQCVIVDGEVYVGDQEADEGLDGLSNVLEKNTSAAES